MLYTPCAVGRRVAPNRWVSQPMEGCDADPGGIPSERTLQRYERLAEGQWGIVVVEATSVTPLALGRLQGLILTQETAARHAKLVRRFKARNSQALLWLQLTHSGPNSHPSTDPTTVNPMPQPGLRYLSTDEIEVIRQQAVKTALLAEEIGYDGIDIKSCNGYLGADLLRPSNTRADRWGGKFQNRARFFVEAFEEIKARRRSDAFVLGVRMHWAERRAGGLGTAGPTSAAYDPAESLELIRLLHRLGLDYVNVTGEVTDLSGYADLEDEERRVPALLAERLAKTLVRDEGFGWRSSAAPTAPWARPCRPSPRAACAPGTPISPAWAAAHWPIHSCPPTCARANPPVFVWIAAAACG